MLPTIRRCLAIAAVATAGVFASVGTAHAAPATQHASFRAASVRTVHGFETVKNTYIVQRNRLGVSYKFSPNHVRVPDCSNPNVFDSFNITNNSAVTQQPTFGGSPLLSPIAPGATEGITVNIVH
jgi:hypothetical protein